MARTYDHLPEKRGEHRAKWHRSPHAMPEATVPLVTEELAQVRADDAAERMRKRGATADAVRAVRHVEFDRIMGHVGDPVDVLFGSA